MSTIQLLPCVDIFLQVFPVGSVLTFTKWKFLCYQYPRRKFRLWFIISKTIALLLTSVGIDKETRLPTFLSTNQRAGHLSKHSYFAAGHWRGENLSFPLSSWLNVCLPLFFKKFVTYGNTQRPVEVFFSVDGLAELLGKKWRLGGFVTDWRGLRFSKLC